jgi:hypothetical protein
VEGTVLTVSDAPRREIVIDVHRVWKGPLDRKMVVYVDRVVGNPHPRPGDRYVFFAITETAMVGRPEVPSGVLLLGCSSVWPPTREVTSQLGRARAAR